MGEHKATVRAETVGAEQAAKDLDKVTQAEESLAGQTSKAGSASETAAKQADKFHASESDVVSLLTQASPTLGAFVDGMLKSGKIAGDLASRNINLKETFGSLSAAIKANAGALKLLGAGAAVAAGIWLIVRALNAEREAMERVNEEIKKRTAAQNELKGAERDRAAEIERLRDASRQGPFDEEEARAAKETAEDVKARAPFIDEAAINRAVAAVGGREDRAGGGRFGIEEIERLAVILERFGQEIDLAGLSGERVDRQATQMLEYYAEKLDAIFAREAGQRRESLQEAGKQAVSLGGATLDLEEFIKRYAPVGADTERLAQLLQQYSELGADRDFGPRRMPRKGDLVPSEEERVTVRVLMELLTRLQAKGTGKGLDAGEVAPIAVPIGGSERDSEAAKYLTQQAIKRLAEERRQQEEAAAEGKRYEEYLRELEADDESKGTRQAETEEPSRGEVKEAAPKAAVAAEAPTQAEAEEAVPRPAVAVETPARAEGAEAAPQPAVAAEGRRDTEAAQAATRPAVAAEAPRQAEVVKPAPLQPELFAEAGRSQVEAARAMERAAARLERAGELSATRAAEPATVHNHLQHARFVTPGPLPRGMVINGENAWERREKG